METVTQVITNTDSRMELLSGSTVKGVQDKTIGMEVKIMGVAAEATYGMKISVVNGVLNKLISSYGSISSMSSPARPSRSAMASRSSSLPRNTLMSMTRPWPS